jgi:hypothetical protein
VTAECTAMTFVLVNGAKPAGKGKGGAANGEGE